MIEQRPGSRKLPTPFFIRGILPLGMQMHLDVVTLPKSLHDSCVPSLCERLQLGMTVLKSPAAQLLHDLYVEGGPQAVTIEDSDQFPHWLELQLFGVARTIAPQLPIVREDQIDHVLWRSGLNSNVVESAIRRGDDCPVAIASRITILASDTSAISSKGIGDEPLLRMASTVSCTSRL